MKNLKSRSLKYNVAFGYHFHEIQVVKYILLMAQLNPPKTVWEQVV